MGPLDPCSPIHFDEGSEERIAGVGGSDGEEEMKQGLGSDWGKLFRHIH